MALPVGLVRAIGAGGLALLASCDPAARARLALTGPGTSISADDEALVVRAVDLEAVLAVVVDVAADYGLDPVDSAEGFEASFHRHWGSVGDGHARSIRLDVRWLDDDVSMEIVVLEWLVGRHTDFGHRILDELESGLRKLGG